MPPRDEIALAVTLKAPKLSSSTALATSIRRLDESETPIWTIRPTNRALLVQPPPPLHVPQNSRMILR